MKSIDEAIAHCLEVAREKERDAEVAHRGFSIFPNDEDQREYDECLACSADHRQLAGWLEELKRHRAIKDSIAAFKRSIGANDNVGNSDYLTGYVCALSAVEGMIEEAENEIDD